MSSMFYRSMTTAAIFLTASVWVSAQNAASPAVSFVGETLKYEGKVTKILRGMSVADLTFRTEGVPNSDRLIIRAEAVSKGTLLKLFRFSFLQEYDSTVDSTFRIFKTVKHDVQKERVRDSEAVFDYRDKRVTFIETDPKDPMRPPRKIASEIEAPVYDMISAIYALRLLPIAVGKNFEFSVSDSGLVYKVPFAVTKREIQKTVLGKVWCFRIEPEIFGPGRLIGQKGKMVIWVVDDARHTPVKGQINTQYGKFDIKLKSASVVN